MIIILHIYKLALLLFIVAITTVSEALMSAASSPNNKPFAVNLNFSIQPSRREEFLSLIKENQKKTLDLEPGALQYFVGEAVDQPNTFYIHEEFVSEESFEAHRAMPHAGDWAVFKSTKPFAEGGEPCLGFYNCLQESDFIPIRSAFSVHVELYIKPKDRNEFLEVIMNSHKCSIKEPFCLQYTVAESTAEENKFILHEEYESNEGFQAHILTPHFSIWENFASKNPFTKSPVIEFFQAIK